MSIVCDTFHRTDKLVLSPFVDNCAGFIPGVAARHIPNVLRLGAMLGIMTKIADDNCGKVRHDGNVDKAPTADDLRRLRTGSSMAREILLKCGARPRTIFVTRPRGAHPGGTAAIGKVVGRDLRTAMKGLYVCDASVLPSAPGLPPMLTLVALAMKFARSLP